MKKHISSVIIVEGKTDSNRLKSIFDVETIETNGSALNKKTINLIKEASKKHDIILFLDPDNAGEMIRRKLEKILPVYKQAFLTHTIIPKNKKGIAEASTDDIKNALANVVDCNNKTNSITWDEYLSLNLNTKEKRLKICDFLGISYANHKQLFKRLNLIGKNLNDIKELMVD